MGVIPRTATANAAADSMSVTRLPMRPGLFRCVTFRIPFSFRLTAELFRSKSSFRSQTHTRVTRGSRGP